MGVNKNSDKSVSSSSNELGEDVMDLLEKVDFDFGAALDNGADA